MQRLCDIFVEAFGLTINLGKSVVLVSRAPTKEETILLTGTWPDCKIVRTHKIVGVLYGYEVRPEERYHEAMQKIP